MLFWSLAMLNCASYAATAAGWAGAEVAFGFGNRSLVRSRGGRRTVVGVGTWRNTEGETLQRARFLSPEYYCEGTLGGPVSLGTLFGMLRSGLGKEWRLASPDRNPMQPCALKQTLPPRPYSSAFRPSPDVTWE